MAISHFEDIVAWQKAHELSIQVYGLLKECRDFGYKDQLQRASVSIMNNIAEGFERQSNKEFKKFLFIAKGSCGEVRSMAHLGRSLGVIDPKQSKELVQRATEVSKILSGLIKTL